MDAQNNNKTALQWEYDPLEGCHVAGLKGCMVTLREVNGEFLVIATGKDWKQVRTQIPGAEFESVSKAAEEWLTENIIRVADPANVD